MVFNKYHESNQIKKDETCRLGAFVGVETTGFATAVFLEIVWFYIFQIEIGFSAHS
jgi:hypothetical protein